MCRKIRKTLLGLTMATCTMFSGWGCDNFFYGTRDPRPPENTPVIPCDVACGNDTDCLATCRQAGGVVPML